MSVTPPVFTDKFPTGLLWPSLEGREILKKFSTHQLLLKDGLVGRQGMVDGSGTSDLIIYQLIAIDGSCWCLKTSLRRGFQNLDEARMALIRLARKKVYLEALMPKNTVLLLQLETPSLYRLWTISPWLTTLRAMMTKAVEEEAETVLSSALRIYAQAAITSMLLGVRNSVLLDIHPSNFALSVNSSPNTEDYCYIDDDIGTGTALPAIGYALLRRVEEYAKWPAALTTYVSVLEELFIKRFKKSDIEKLDLITAFEQTMVRSNLAEDIRNHLVKTLSRCQND